MFIDKPRRQPRAPKKHRGQSYYLTHRDVRILQYIWKWKIASSSSIHEAINRPGSIYSTFKVLERLEKNSFIESRFEYAERFYVWQLTEQGFLAIKNYLGELSEDGFLSENHRHDRLVQAFQLGEWATNQYPRIVFFTEQDLRRRDMDDFPDWIPQTKEHRPDGYTRLVGEKKAVTYAYEIELSQKHLHKYESVLRFYKNATMVDRVLWLVGSPFIREQIVRAKTCIRDESTNYHVFVDLGEYVAKGWDATATNERSEILFPLREMYRGICGGLSGEIIAQSQGNSKVSVHLDGRKVQGKSKA